MTFAMGSLAQLLHFVSGFAVEVARLIAWLLLLALIFVPLERLFSARPMAIFRRGFWTDLGYFFISGFVPNWLLIVPTAMLAVAAQRWAPAPLHAWVAEWPLWLRLAAMLVVGDIGGYWAHRLLHTVPTLWRFHAIHHSATEIDWLVNTRAHPVDQFFTRLVGIIPIYMLGLAQPTSSGVDIYTLIYILAGTVWGFFVHANVRWRFGWLEHLLATPAYHHWHHANDGAQFVDKNFAAIFPWIDRMFGTLYLPNDRLPVNYGIDAPTAPDLKGQLLQPFAAKP